jgi:outer membrane receptor protein involved in Fe transport
VFKAICRTSLIVTVLFLLNVFHSEIVYAQAAKAIFAQVSGQVVTLRGAPVPSATVQLDGTVHIKTTADTGGHFVFANVAPGTYTITASAGGYTAVSRNGIVVQNEDVNLNIQLASTAVLKEIGHVTSTPVRSTINVTAAPSYRITPADMAFQGQTQWRKVLEEIPGVSVSGIAAGVSEIISGNPLNAAVISIRGSLPYETAMLIDNMPMYGISFSATAAGAGVDISPYSPYEFGATDVIEGPGAQSPSIVGAIGGSMNLHPVGQVTKNSYSLSLSDDPYGGWIANGSTAVRIGKLSASVTYDFNNSPGPIFGSQELFTAQSVSAINGTPYKCVGTCAVTSLFSNGTGNSASGISSGLIGCCTPNAAGYWTSHGESLSLFYQLSHSMTAQFFFADRNTPSTTVHAELPLLFLPGPGYTGSLAAGSVSRYDNFPWQPTTATVGSQIYEGKLTFQLGRGQLQLAALSNRTELAETVSTPASLGAAQLFGTGCTASVTTVAPCPAGFAPIVFNGASVSSVSLTPFSQLTAIHGHNRDLSANYAVPLGDRARASASIVHSYYDSSLYTNVTTTPGSFALPQSNFETTDEMRLGYGLTPSDRTSLDFTYYFANTRFHVVNPNSANALQASLAQVLYQDQVFHYNAPRLSFVWHPNHDLAVRASAGGGFAPAPLGDLVGTNGAASCSSAACSITLTNVNLQPETSWGYDVGFDKRLGQSTILSFDIYTTTLQGQIYKSTTSIAPCATCLGQPTFATQFNNLGQSRYQGIELDMHRDVPRGVIWSASGSLMRAYLVSVPANFYTSAAALKAGLTCNPTTNANCTNQQVLPNINFNGLFIPAANIPYAQGFAQYGYRWSPDHFVSMDMHYFGNNNGYYSPAFVVFDANAQIRLTKNVALQGTFRNITGQLDNAVLYTGQGYVYPTAAGPAAYVYTTPYGPRTFLLTLNVHS